jgi:DNA-3-methyladenine glycosylase II
MNMQSTLADQTLLHAVASLAAIDSDLARILAAYGPPPLWAREPGFPTLILLILEQQVSLASARAAFNRLADRLGAVTPAAFLTLNDDELRAVGFSRQKTGYGRHLAQAMVDGRCDADALAALDDDGVRANWSNSKASARGPRRSTCSWCWGGPTRGRCMTWR